MRPASVRWLVVLLAVAACTRSLEAPPPPTPKQAGTLQGSVFYAQQGRSTLSPARGATVELLGSSVTTVAQGDNAFFTLSPILVTSGTVVIRFDSDGDGTPDRQKALQLEDL